MNTEQAKRQAELVYEASQHLGEEEAQRLYDETLENLRAAADDADDADGGVSIADARRAAVITAPTTPTQYSARRRGQS